MIPKQLLKASKHGDGFERWFAGFIAMIFLSVAAGVAYVAYLYPFQMGVTVAILAAPFLLSAVMRQVYEVRYE